MDTYEQIKTDNQYPGDLDNENYLSSKKSNTQQESMNKDEEGGGFLGRRVYLESPSFDNKEEEDMYRYVSSRLTDRTASIIGATTIPLPAPVTNTGAPLMDTFAFELDTFDTNQALPEIPHRQEINPVVPQGRSSENLTNVPRIDPRQDPLLGPLLAELDMISQQQQQVQPQSPSLSRSIYQRNSVPYEPNLLRPVSLSQPDHALTNIADRTATDALLEAELYDVLDPQNQHRRPTIPFSAPNLNLSNYSPSRQQQPHISNMDNTDTYIPPSYSSGPGPFLSHFGPEDQLFQRPLLNTLGQNYVPNLRPSPSQQQNTTFDQAHTYMSPPQRISYTRPQLPPNHLTNQPPLLYPISSNQQNTNLFNEYQRVPTQTYYDEQIPRQVNPSHNQQLFFTDHRDDNQFGQQQPSSTMISQRSNERPDQDSKRQAIWNELQNTSAKAQEQNAKKRDSTNRVRGTFGSNSTWNNSDYQQSSNLYKSSPQRSFHHPPIVPKPNYNEDNVDTIKNKENFNNRSPTRKYENIYLERRNFYSGNIYEKHEQDSKTESLSRKPQRQTSLPITVNLNTSENSQNSSMPRTVTIPLESRINRDGDKISLNIDLRLVDLQNFQQQQTTEHPQWSSLDPLDRHIRKLERNLDEALPATNPPQRSPTIPNTGVNASMGRYGKASQGTIRSGYNPPVYGGDYNYNNRNAEDETYLSNLNYARKYSQFKPYTTREYEQFKKSYGFGVGHLGFQYDINTTHKEKLENMAKTKGYAQQIEARNKKKLSDSSRRTLSDTRLRADAARPAPRSHGSTQISSIRRKVLSGISTHSSPASMNRITQLIPARRPTEVLHRPLPAISQQLTRLTQYENNESYCEQDRVSEKSTLNSSQKQREQNNENEHNYRINKLGRLGKNRRNQRTLILPKRLPPVVVLTNDNNKRRPIKFDQSPLSDSNLQKDKSLQETTNVDQLSN